jgi:mannan endo-1,4-beta-mannosidase
MDANEKPFIMRGLAVPLVWFVSDVKSNIVNIKKVTNANCLRIVISTSTSDVDWQACVKTCIANNIIPEVELHDQTCGTTSSGLATLANWWVSKKSFLTNPAIEKYILINIANEWGDWNMAKNSPTSWRDAYINAVSIMRRGGISTTLVIDAPNCGQDMTNGSSLKSYALTVFNSDSLKNCLFTVHLYGEWCPGGGSSPANLPSIKNAGIPFIVGEFADQSSQGNLDELTVMSKCQSNNIGWMAWSWKGNNEPVLDMSNDWAGTSLTPWGNICVNTVNGLRNTSQMASVFTGDSGCIPTTIIPYAKINEGSLSQVSEVIVNIGDSIVISPKPDSGGNWKWSGPNGYTSTIREVSLTNMQSNQSGYYIATYTNSDSCISSASFHISVVAYAAGDTLLSGATYKIINKFSGKAIDITNSSVDDGAFVIQKTPVDSLLSQEWMLKNISGSNWQIVSANSGKVLDVVGASKISGAPINQMVDTLTALNMKWQFTKDNLGYYQIKNVKSSDCLDLIGISSLDGTAIIQGTCITDDNQKFTLIKLKDPVVGITKLISNNLSIYPNPNDNGQFILSTGLNGTQNIEIYDLQGKLKYCRILNETKTTINSKLNSGIYIVKLTNNQTVISLKLIVN